MLGLSQGKDNSPQRLDFQVNMGEIFPKGCKTIINQSIIALEWYMAHREYHYIALCIFLNLR